MLREYLTWGQPLLDGRFPLPLDLPFTRRAALDAGIQSCELSRLCSEGYLRRLVEGVYVAAQTPDSLALRARALALVVPPDAVVTDRTAGWLHGAEMVLAPGDHLVVPRVSMFVDRRGARLRNDVTASGQRLLPKRDVMVLHGIRVTTPLRTACDLGRLLRRDSAFAALDAMLSLKLFGLEDLWDATHHLRGMRGVRQLRALVPLADGRAESPGESVLRLRWIDLGTSPGPEPQIEVERPGRWSYWIDVGIDSLRYGAEYDGEQWHRRTPEQVTRDRRRRTWLREERGWIIDPVTHVNLWGRQRDIEEVLLDGMRNARRRL